MNYAFILSLLFTLLKSLSTHAKDINSIPSIIEDGKWYIIEITSLCTKDISKHLDYDAVRQHLRLRYLIGRQQHLAPRMKFGFASFDVCNDIDALTIVLSEIFLNEKYRGYNQNEIESNKQCYSRACNSNVLRNEFETNILVVITRLSTPMTTHTSRVMNTYYIPHYAYQTDTNNHYKLLTTQYDHFLSSEELLYSDIYIVISDYIVKYGFKHIAFVSIKSNSRNLFQPFHQEHFFEDLTNFHNVCVEMKEINLTEIKAYVREINKDESIRMIMIWGERNIQEAFINETVGLSSRVWLWYSEGAYSGGYPYKSDKSALINHVFIRQPFFLFQPLRNRFSFASLRRNVRPDIYRNILSDPWIKRFNMERKMNSTVSDVFAHFDSNLTIAGEHSEAIIFPLWWVQPFRWLKTLPINIFWARLYKLSKVMLGKHHFRPSGNTTFFDYDRTLINDYFEHISRVSKGECKPQNCKAGFEPKKEVFAKKGYVKVFEWHCVPCREGFVKFGSGTQSCTTCPGLTVPNEKQTGCFDPYKDIFLNFTDFKSIILLCLIAPCSALNLLAIFVYLRYRTTPIVTASGATVSLIQLTTHFVITIQVIPTFFGELNTYKCAFQVVVFGVLLTLILSFIFTKTHKMIFAFNAQVQISKTDVIISKAVEIFVSVTLVLVQVVISVLGYFQLNPTIEIILNKNELTRMTKCQNMSYYRAHYIYILVLTIMCTVQAFRARSLPKYFTETTEIVYSMYITLVIIIVRFPIVASRQIEDKNFANAMFTLMANNFLMFVRFSKPVFIVLFQPEKNTKEHIRNAIMERVRKVTEQKMAERIRKNTSTTTLGSDLN